MNDNATINQLFNDKSVVVTPIIGRGDVNRVYIVKHENGQFIVRLNSVNELNRFKKEAWCLEEALKQNIPSPRLIDIGVKNDTAYMILSFIVGKNGSDIREKKGNTWQEIGSYAKKINSISTRGFGERMTSTGDFDDSWERYLTYNIQSLNNNDKLLQLGVLTKERLWLVKERFISLKDKQFHFGLIHGDLSLENVIVENDKVTLIDWGVAESTIVPHMEIIDLLQNQMSDTDIFFDSFLLGYGMDVNEYKLLKPDIETLTLLRAIDKLRWAIDRKQDKIEEFSQRVKLLIGK